MIHNMTYARRSDLSALLLITHDLVQSSNTLETTARLSNHLHERDEQLCDQSAFRATHRLDPLDGSDAESASSRSLIPLPTSTVRYLKQHAS